LTKNSQIYLQISVRIFFVRILRDINSVSDCDLSSKCEKSSKIGQKAQLTFWQLVLQQCLKRNKQKEKKIRIFFVKELPKNCQKIVKRMSKNCQKFVNNFGTPGKIRQIRTGAIKEKVQ
jgi:hypothetical protein